ncbi:MAG TPA: M17 family peptidase N-terminal domain-containing protein, partial [Acidimicrobiales bacterium]|nr:M17 family peptidase N-terminal domain-containing protein [Acidimicrobiales bacterium]
MPITFAHARSVPRAIDVVALGVPQGAVDESGLDADVLAARGFEGKVGQAELVAGPDGNVTVAVGLGPVDEIGPTALRGAGAAFARAASRRHKAALRLLDHLPEGADAPACARALVEGVALASYRFRAYKAEP